MTRSDADYPMRLKKRLKFDAPPVLFGCGNRHLLDQGGIAIVGSRDANAEDLTYTLRLGADISHQGHAVISGGARGVDEAAMMGALEQDGAVVGVLADSLLRTATSAKYRRGLMAKNLVLISPFNPEAGFDVGNAMARNKYIYCLADAETWLAPKATLTFAETSRCGKKYTVEIQAWHTMLMTGKTKPEKLPMHECPFTHVRIVRYDKEGKPAFKKPLWLIVMGDRQAELALAQIYEAYAVRFDIEHFFRFGKQKLLMGAFQTPEVKREENWFQLTQIAYAQLWMARHLVHGLPRPWARNLPAMQQRLISPTLVQRDFGRIIRHFGTPAQPPKPRNILLGRPKGTILLKRTRHPVVVKGKTVASAT